MQARARIAREPCRLLREPAPNLPKGRLALASGGQRSGGKLVTKMSITSAKSTCLSGVRDPTEMHCKNGSTRGTISESRDVLGPRCSWGLAEWSLRAKIGCNLKQLTACVPHLCTKGKTRVSRGSYPRAMRT